jgi:ribose transport system permease protein
MDDDDRMKKILGILGLLIAIGVFTALSSDRFLLADNIENVIHRTSLFGILAIGAAFVIITGGIDLSIGSMVCLVGVLLPYLLTKSGWSPWLAIPVLMGLSVGIGLLHGTLVTKVRLQPFVVTLCGLLLYRGIARGLTQDQSQGFGREFTGLRAVANGKVALFGDASSGFQLPVSVIALGVVMVAAIVFLRLTVWGRYLLALGRNETAARYSGINTSRMILLAYTICAALAGVGGMLFVLDINAAQPSDFGNFYELYAIAAAVLGGCSLRGGEGSIIGVVIGAAVMVVLSNMINLVYPDYQNMEFAIIGAVILAGVIVDEFIRRVVARRRTRGERMMIESASSSPRSPEV